MTVVFALSQWWFQDTVLCWYVQFGPARPWNALTSYGWKTSPTFVAASDKHQFVLTVLGSGNADHQRIGRLGEQKMHSRTSAIHSIEAQ